MSKCKSCRVNEGLDTIPEKIASWIVRHVFPKTLKDETNASRLQGFEQGYAESGKAGQELKQIHYQLDRFEDQQAQLILQILKDHFPHA